MDFISHSIKDGTLFFSVAFKDKTRLWLRFACQMLIVGADFAMVVRIVSYNPRLSRIIEHECGSYNNHVDISAYYADNVTWYQINGRRCRLT